ncbi:uncharacterized protein, partial [Battus philenor]|uniref:uncharacterized protein n=1 Tax=Battus philenor TaxID=42288 RepID=UPI0035D0FA7F
RAVHDAAGEPSFIPAGIDLGGYSMMRLEDSFLFFHRMKLRNNTHFRVNHLHTDLANMVLLAKLSLNDLHILGAYERTTTGSNPSVLFYTPTYGEAEFLLKNVQYNMEGRYRLLRNKLTIELIVSDIVTSDIMMTVRFYKNYTKPITLQRKDIEEFLDRLKTDLDKWLKDYFNDYLMYFGLEGKKAFDELLQYDKEKTVLLNEHADQVIENIKKRLNELKYTSVQVPKFTIMAVNGMQLKLTNGALRGLDTIHRRSLATSKKEEKLRKLDTIVGFSNLKATYQYEAVFNTGMPPINGILVVTADELVTHMGMTMSENSETLDVLFDSIHQIRPESLTLEGPANRAIGNFKNLLERLVFTFITNSIIHNVRMLQSITKCEPLLSANVNTEEKYLSQENESLQNNEKANSLNNERENLNNTI